MPVADDKIRVPVTMTKSLKNKLTGLAEADNRKIGNYILHIMEQHVEQLETAKND